MTNNKQQTAVKLYTEEQLMKAIELAKYCEYDCGGVYFDFNLDSILLKLTHIEIPSDEEINEMGIDVIIYNDTKRGWFVEGLKFMRDKIQGGQQ
jgi:hypothetical protein